MPIREAMKKPRLSRWQEMQSRCDFCVGMGLCLNPYMYSRSRHSTLLPPKPPSLSLLSLRSRAIDSSTCGPTGRPLGCQCLPVFAPSPSWPHCALQSGQEPPLGDVEYTSSRLGWPLSPLSLALQATVFLIVSDNRTTPEPF